MTQDDLSTVQLPRASEEATPYLLEQMPWLKEIDIEDLKKGGREEISKKLRRLTEKYGEYHNVIPMRPEDHENLSPEEDMRRLGFTGKIIKTED